MHVQLDIHYQSEGFEITVNYMHRGFSKKWSIFSLFCILLHSFLQFIHKIQSSLKHTSEVDINLRRILNIVFPSIREIFISSIIKFVVFIVIYFIFFICSPVRQNRSSKKYQYLKNMISRTKRRLPS